MQISSAKLALLLILLVFLSLLNTSCSKNYDLVSEYVVVDELQVSIQEPTNTKNSLLAHTTKSEIQTKTITTSN